MVHYVISQGDAVPTIFRLGRIKIQIFADDHNPPHFHVVTPDRQAMLSIAGLEILRGELSRRDLETVLAWLSDEDRIKEIADAWTKLNG